MGQNSTAQTFLTTEEKLRLLVESATDYAIFTLDVNGNVSSWNLGAERIKGYQADEIMGKHFSCFYSPEDLQSGKPERELSLVRMQGKVEDEGWRVRKDGSKFWANVVITALRDDDGDLIGFSKITRDLTERKRAEEEVLALNRELQRKNSELVALNRELESFSYSVSHDLRAPLRAIDGFSLAILEDYQDKVDDDGRKLLQRVRAAVTRMGLLIDDMLNLARIARAEMADDEVDVSRLAEDVIEDLRGTNPERKISVSIAPGLIASGDRNLLRIALHNLLGNAWKFTASRPEACISFGRTIRSGEAVFFIKDNGAGFDMRYAHKLFGAFQRLHSDSAYPGTGIGLATVHRIIMRHGGRIWAEAAPEKGATFYFVLT